jgi:hypothetical protein
MRYWLKTCFNDPLHHLNYSAPTYLPALGASVFWLHDNICDALYTRRCSNFRVVCTNKLISIGPQLSDDAAKEISQMWGSDHVHPSMAAYEALATVIERDVLIEDVKYINAPKSHGDSAAKKQETDLCRSRQGWVVGCSAAVPRRDTIPSSRGHCGRGSRGSGGRSKSWQWKAGRGSGGRGGWSHK